VLELGFFGRPGLDGVKVVEEIGGEEERVWKYLCKVAKLESLIWFGSMEVSMSVSC
jgi:hypothetical protein